MPNDSTIILIDAFGLKYSLRFTFQNDSGLTKIEPKRMQSEPQTHFKLEWVPAHRNQFLSMLNVQKLLCHSLKLQIWTIQSINTNNRLACRSWSYLSNESFLYLPLYFNNVRLWNHQKNSVSTNRYKGNWIDIYEAQKIVTWTASATPKKDLVRENERDIEIFESVLNNNGIFVHLTCKSIRRHLKGQLINQSH